MIVTRGAKWVAIAAVCTGVSVPGAGALPLKESACERYAAEVRTMTRLGVHEHFRKGADWARANLTRPQQDLIHRYIRIHEALKFRCPDRFAAMEQPAADEPRRLDVMPPAPLRKPQVQRSGAGVTRKQIPPLPARGAPEQG